ncbi:putative ATP-dependent RNA helicase DDX56 isoform X2 [Branchiostoma floridae x Branchiostoma belcheri]
MADEGEKSLAFHEMGLDDRLLKAIASQGWRHPTLIQERSIPLALEGKDLLARARTGSGKTAAFVIPIIQRILDGKQAAKEQAVKALVLTPSKELCSQAYKNCVALSSCCSREVRCLDISGSADITSQRPMLMEKPDIVIGTPSRVLAHIQGGNLELKNSLEMLVIDEADLVFSFGYEKDIKTLLGHLPKIYQAFLMSATLSEDVQALKKLILHNPVTLKLEESQLPEADRLTQYHIKCEESDKFLLIYTLLKLRLVRGKTILFVNSIDRCYRLKLFLEQFSIPACVLNSELPVSSRCHIVNQFNQGLYNLVIATDESALDAEDASMKDKTGKAKKKAKRFKKKKDKEYGVSRGIDFQFVSNVINFDFPAQVEAYIHRVGRTARGDSQGTALSLISAQELSLLQQAEDVLSGDADNPVIKPYRFKMEEIEGFRYRAKDALRSVTKTSVREARLKEIRSEILNSEKLKSYFEDNPRDLQVLRHDKALAASRVKPHMKNVPEYLMPPSMKSNSSVITKRPQHFQGGRREQKRHKKRKEDPLRSFKYRKEES